MKSETLRMLRESMQLAIVAADRASRITRPSIPAVKRPGAYSFISLEEDPQCTQK